MIRYLPPYIARNLRYRFIALAVPIAIAIGAGLLLVFWLLAHNLIDQLGGRISTDQVMLDRARAALPLTREFTLAEALARDPALIAWSYDPDDADLRYAGLQSLERFRTLFQDRNYFFVPDASKDFYFNDKSEPNHDALIKYTINENNPDDAWYFSTTALPGACYLNIDFDRALRETKVWFNCNVRDPKTDAVLGIVGTGIDLTNFIDELQKSQPDGVTTIYVDAEGAIQAHPNVALIEHDALTKRDNLKSTIFNILETAEDQVRLRESLAAARAAPDKASTVTVHIDGMRVLVGASFMPEINWFSISVIDLRTLVFGVYFIPLAVLVALAVIVSLTALAIALDRIVLRRIDHLDHAVTVFKEDNAVTIDEPVDDDPDQIDRLRMNFNEMSAAVQAHTSELSDLVEERTRELQKNHDELVISNRQKDKFFSIIAHDLIGPFSSLIGVSDFLKNRADNLSREKIAEYTGDLNDAATNLHRLLENLLAWSRLQRGDVRFAPELTDLPALLTETIEIMKPMATQKKMEISLEAPAGVTAIVDPHMVETIARNLLGNAIKFSLPGKRITVRLAPDTNGTWLHVEDQGVGIDAATLEKLREIGATPSQKGTAGETGTGLGLQLCFEMVELHGGRIEIESKTGTGTAFHVFFPADAPNSAS
ncbi:MAG: sensor histidine kinase [Rhodospirillales bacterium]|nr:sensor histidine kinase [Rhodospirillales bacterium]MBO6785921.1 sensor histidine kinase [Rhodospirillales bacterium]